jgi:hypothetical protein
MTAYTGIQGQNILIVSSDPANPVEGQIWYNSTSNLLKGYIALSAGWASGGNLNTGRSYSRGVGTPTATITTGGYTGGPPAIDTSTATESYNGSSWTTTPATINTGRYGSGVSGNGTQTAALFGGGTSSGTSALSNSESYNGSAWTATPVLATATMYGSGCGTQTAMIIAGGGPTHVSQTYAVTQLWNGSSWTNSPASLNTGRGDLLLFGIQTSAIAAGSPAPAVELWNGTSWTTTTAMPGARSSSGGSGASSASGLLFGGYPNLNTTVAWTGPGSFGTKTITVS